MIGLLLSDGLGPTGVAVARVLGIGLLSVGVAGWESQGQDIRLAPRAGLCTYNVGAAIVLAILGTYGGMNGILLWPAALLHALIGAMMLWVILALWPMLSNESELLFTPLKSLTGQAETFSVSGWDVGEGEARILSQRREHLGGGQFSRFEYQFRMRRQLGFFIYKVFLPLALIILMAWTVFFLPPLEIRSQISIGVTSMLTLIAYQLAVANTLPRISYLTRADHFIFGSWILVFLALAKSIFTSCMVHQDKSALASKVNAAGRWAYAAAFLLILGFAFVL